MATPQGFEFLEEIDNRVNAGPAATTRKSLFRAMKVWVLAVEGRLEEDREALLQLQTKMVSLEGGFAQEDSAKEEAAQVEKTSFELNPPTYDREGNKE